MQMLELQVSECSPHSQMGLGLHNPQSRRGSESEVGQGRRAAPLGPQDSAESPPTCRFFWNVPVRVGEGVLFQIRSSHSPPVLSPTLV